MPPIGISTCWRSAKAETGDDLLRALAPISVRNIELEYRITERMFHQIRPMLGKEFRVLSIHNFFPHPGDLAKMKPSGDLFNFASPDAEERAQAVKRTLRTLEIASDLEVDRVVVHVGSVQGMEPEVRARLDAFEERGARSSSPQPDLEKLLAARSRESSRHLDRVLFALEALIVPAVKLGVSICLENRFFLHELPNREELDRIFHVLGGDPLGFWLDVGHAASQDALGACPMKAWLEPLPAPFMGVHVHDCKGVTDHLPPSRGDMDWDMLRPTLEGAPVVILEIEDSYDADAVNEGISFVQNEILGG